MTVRASPRSWCGAGVSFILLRRVGGRRRDQWCVLRQRTLRRLIHRFSELHGPGVLLRGVDLEEPGAVIAAREAILDAANGELFFARAHVGLAGPFAAAVIVDRIDIIKACDKRA